MNYVLKQKKLVFSQVHQLKPSLMNISKTPFTSSSRKEEDEICLFNAAFDAAKNTMDRFSSSLGEEKVSRFEVIDRHIARHVALVLGSLMTPNFKPGVPPPGLTYAIEVQDSSIQNPDAGRGLFIRGKAIPGDIIAFYPGTVYTAEEIKAFGGLKQLVAQQEITSTDYLRSRSGGIVIDALGSSISVNLKTHPELHSLVSMRNNNKSDNKDLYDAWPLPKGQLIAGALNAWANGHFVNHPPPNESANVIAWPYDFPPQCPPSLFPFLPNTYGMKIKSSNHQNLIYDNRLSRHSIVLVAAKELNDGDECFVDYALSKNEPTKQNNDLFTLPSWYKTLNLRGDILIKENELNDADAPENKFQTQRDICMKALHEWKDSFTKQNSRTPTRHDIVADPVAAALFTEFQRLNTLEWEE